MNKASVQTIELGNLLFGHSRGEYAIGREEFQEPFHEFLHNHEFDIYGLPDTDARAEQYVTKDGDNYFENDVFLLRPYYWGEDEEIAARPNFVYKPEGITIEWYKYSLRDAYCNKDISLEKFLEILQVCADSLE